MRAPPEKGFHNPEHRMTQSFNPVDALVAHGPSSFAHDFSRYLVASVVMAGVVWGLRQTAFASRTIQARRASAADIRREFFSSLRTCMVYVTVTLIMIWGISNGVFREVAGSRGMAVDLAILGGILLAHDAYFYWVHRAMHHPRLFKTFHRHHHRSITPTPFAAYSFAVPEALVMALFVPLWQLFVATPFWVLGVFLNFQILRNVMGHAGIELHPRWWLATPLTRWINTTTHHDLHHNGNFNRNYGLYFGFWDRLMGTEHPDYVQTFNRVTAPAPSTALASSPGL
jgi:sterol desaturase/sphingolipid hydroxylase (fatty acid hydroxylase superfamily)